MFEMTNAQRRCLALEEIPPSWTRLALPRSKYDAFDTVLYLDGDIIRRRICSGPDLFEEAELFVRVSDDMILPQTAAGKPIKLTAASIAKRPPSGVWLSWSGRHVDLFCETSQCSYYNTDFEADSPKTEEEFAAWVKEWCEETDEQDLADLAEWKARTQQHVRVREGDVFRFKLSRRLYGYGRVVLDYGALKKRKIPHMPLFMGKPLICSIYHLVTPRRDVTLEELRECTALPSKPVMDNKLYYGEYEVIGNLPVEPDADYPIHYGRSTDLREGGAMLQRGTHFVHLPDATVLYRGHELRSIGFAPDFIDHPMLYRCMDAKSNAPYWERDIHPLLADLRHPANAKKRHEIGRQMNINLP